MNLSMMFPLSRELLAPLRLRVIFLFLVRTVSIDLEEKMYGF